MSAPVRRARRSLARVAPWVVGLLALPLLAPTCGGQQPGIKAFSKGSLVIPMDACYQNTPNQLTSGALFPPAAGCPTSGATTSDSGNVLRAYGLVYQLLRNNIPVYWVINSSKTGPHDGAHPDITIAYATGGATGPVDSYDGTGTRLRGMPPNNAGSSISYLGGPFVVDGSDAAAALTAMGSLGTSFQTVKVHRANVAFSAEVARAMSGNFSNSGDTVPPPIALLNITGGDNKNSEVVIQGYLNDAGLGAADFTGAGGVATPTGHGKIYDDLYPADFLPTSCTGSCANGAPCSGGQCAPNLVAYGYSILWVPHWCGPGSETRNPSHPFPGTSGYADVLAAIRAYLAAGHDVLAECASLGTFEGVNNSAVCSGSATGYPSGSLPPAMQVKTTSGVNINGTFPAACNGTPPSNPTACEAAATFLPTPSPARTTFATPFLQIGDFPFYPVTGAIQNYLPTAAYVAGTIRLIGDTTSATQDYFTWLPAAAPRGNLVYLAGHDYSGGQTAGGIQIGGSRLVLNSLFNLGASCKPRTNPDGSPMACQQLKNLGACRAGTWQCCDSGDISRGYCQVGGEPVCRPLQDPPPAGVDPCAPGSPYAAFCETCNGLDDNCDGIVDNVPSSDAHVASPACYDGPAATVNPASGLPYGVCQRGTWSCQQTPTAHWACVGEVLPSPSGEVCNGLDDDCNGIVDDPGALTPPGGSPSCFTGPAGTVMHATFAPSPCTPGTWACQQTGTAQNPSAAWDCLGQVLPALEQCEGALADYNCNGTVADGCDCVLGTVRSCSWPTLPGSPIPGVGICRAGTQTCISVGGHDVWDNCAGQVLPQPENCTNGLDNDCNGAIDACTECSAGQARPCYPPGTAGCDPKPAGGCPAGTTESGGFCCKGVCATGEQLCAGGKWGACQGSVTPAPVELCNGKNDRCSDLPTDQGAGATCIISGFDCSDPTVLDCCINGSCARPTWSSESDCFPGYVHGTGSDAGKCVAANCALSPAGANRPCPPGTVCQPDGTCLDPCQGVSCGEGAYCSTVAGTGAGICVGGGCYATGCGSSGQVCRNATCQADVCSGAACPAGTFCRGDYAVTPAVYDCVRLCATVSCPAGQACIADGSCAPDPCATVTCPAGQACIANGSCAPDPCPPGHCGAHQACLDGRCTDDPCAGITCPAGVCARGQCYASNNPFGYGRPAPAGAGGGGCGCGGGDSGPTALLLALLVLPLARRRRVPALARARRRGTGGLPWTALALALGLGLSGAACGKKATAPQNCETCGSDHCVDVKFDAAHCGACATACPTGNACVDAICILASPSVPGLASVTPAPVAAHTTPTLTLVGERFQSGAKLKVSGAGLPAAELATTFGSSTQLTAPVDLTAAQVGKLALQVVNPDRTVSNAVSIDVGVPTPSITGLSPSSALAGTRPLVHVSGAGITPSAICVQGSGAGQIAIPPEAAPTPTGLDCTLDLTDVAPGPLRVVIQNENSVQSPPGSFTVTTSTPVIDPGGLNPNQAPQGAVILLTVTGSGFVPTSRIQIQQGTTWVSYPTDSLAPTALRAEVSLASFDPGDYPVRVDAPGPTPSDPRVTSAPASSPLRVTAAAPLATGLTVTPSAPRLGQTGVQLAFSGAGFATGCLAQVLASGASDWTAHAVTTLPGVTAGSLQASTDLTGGAEGTWLARVDCPTGCPSPPCLTSAFPFVVATNVASLATVTPAGGAQSTSLSYAVTGQNFQAGGGMTLRLSGVSGDIPTVADLVSPGTKATARIDLAGVDVGSHTLVAVNAGAAPSNPIAFSVTPGVPSISGLAVSCPGAGASGCRSAPACAVQQPSLVTVTISGANFGTGLSTVYATAPGLPKVDVSTVPNCTVTIASATAITIVLDTTQVLPTTYTLSVENPGPAPGTGWPTASFQVTTTTCP